MLRVSRDHDITLHSKFQRVGTNQPEKRQMDILIALLRTFPPSIILGTRNSCISDQILVDELKVCSQGYCDFLRNAYSAAVYVGDKDWVDEKEGLLPYHIYKGIVTPTLLANTPYYKQCALYGSDRMTPIIDTTYQSVFMSAENSYNIATEMMRLGPGNLYYVLNSQPGHHAGFDTMRGYCFLNNAMIAARRMRQLDPESKVAVLDIDYHHGDGAQELNLAGNDSSIMTVSIHGANDYPNFCGFESDNVPLRNLNIPIAAGADWSIYSKALELAFKHLNEFGFNRLIIAFGADTMEGDPDPSNKAGMKLQLEDYFKMGQLIRNNSGDMSILVTQEGGYSSHVDEIAAQFIKGLLN